MADIQSSLVKSESKNPIDRVLAKVDHFQQRRRPLAIIYAVIKKYGDDEAGYQGGLITYYGFLSLFPLLIVATSVIDLVSRHNNALRGRLISSINQYFPNISTSLQSQLHGSNKTGIALIIGTVITLYGAKGIADAVQHALNHVWQVPRPKRAGFPKAPLKSFGLIAGASIGFVGAAVLSGFAAGNHQLFIYRFLLSLASLAVLFATFIFVFRFGTSAKHNLHDNFPGAIVAAAGIQVLQSVGSYLISSHLKSLDGLYGQFALVLVILFWLALQAQIFMYAAEINTVRALRLYPRSITQKVLTSADKKAFRLYAEKEAYRPKPEEEIEVTFPSQKK